MRTQPSSSQDNGIFVTVTDQIVQSNKVTSTATIFISDIIVCENESQSFSLNVDRVIEVDAIEDTDETLNESFTFAILIEGRVHIGCDTNNKSSYDEQILEDVINKS